MLEYPEARVIARQMAQSLAGRTLVSAEVGKKPHRFAWFTGDPSLLAGRVADGADAAGGMPALRFGEARMAFSDGANPQYISPGAKKPDQHQLLLSFDDDSAVVVRVAMYGGVYTALAGDIDNPYYTAAREAVDPLSDAFDDAAFSALFDAASARKTSLKALLATEQRIPGLGNGVLQDILLNAGMHPRRDAASLSTGERTRLLAAIKSTLEAMTRLGGRDTEKDFYGAEGGYRTMLSRKNTALLCPKCGGSVSRQAYMGGNVYFCPACQPLA